MGERDAFGRETGEDSLQEMGWRADLSAPAEQQPVKPPSVQWLPPKAAPPRTEERPAAAGAAGPARGPSRGGADWPGAAPRLARVRPRRRRSFARLIFMLALIVVIAATAGSLVRGGKVALDEGQNAIRGAIPSTTAPKASGSLLRPAALRKALK